MRLKQFSVLLVTCFTFHRIQPSLASNHEVYFEDVNVEFLNETYIDIDTFDVSIVYKPNSKNSLNVKVDIIADAPKNLSIKLMISPRAFGRDIRTGLSFDSNLCEGRAAKIYFDEVLTPLGITDCPPKLGSYGNEDYQPNLLRIPTHFLPGNNILIDTELHASEISILKCKMLMSI